MQNPPFPFPEPAELTESQRLDALRALGVLDTSPEPLFDALTHAASILCGAPIALVSLIDADRQWFKSQVGLPGVGETARCVAFCDHAIRDDDLFEVCDAAAHPLFQRNPLVVGEPHIRFYAGVPIVMPDGARIGTLCVIDRIPRRLTTDQRDGLHSLGQAACEALVARGQQIATNRRLAASEARYRTIVEGQTEMISLATRDGLLRFVNPAYARQFGLQPDDMTGRNLFDFVDPGDREAVRGHLEAVWVGSEPVSGVNRVRAADGSHRWIAWTNRRIDAEEGRPAKMHSVGRDITEQRLAETALEESERRYRSLYEATPAMLHSIDPTGRLVHVSDRWLRTLGYRRDEVIGRPSVDFLTADSARRARETVLPAFLREGSCEGVEYQFVHRQGHAIDMRLSAILERAADGTPQRSLAVLEDMRESHRLAAALDSTHARLDAIVENMPALLAHVDGDGLLHFANREFQAAFGLPMQEIVGQPLRATVDRTDPLCHARLAPHIALVQQGRRQEFELPLLTISGLRQLRVTLVPDRRPDGPVGGFYGMAFDITGRKALELRLRESEQRYRSLFDHLNSGFALHKVVLDAEGRPIDYQYLAMNAAFAALSGLSPESTIGRRVTEVLPGIVDDPGDWIGRLGAVALSGEPAHFEQYAAVLDGWFDVVAYCPAPGQFAVIAQDITARKRSEARVQEALSEKETLLKEVYHRVKNNLQVVQSLLTLQRRSTVDAAARTALEESVQRVRAMALVHEKLYQSGSLAAIALADYTRDLLKQIGEATGAASQGIALVAEIGDFQTALDSAIPFGLLVTELVTNAAKHAFPGGRRGSVRVALSAVEGGARLEVADDGPGVAEGFAIEDGGSMGLQLAFSLARQLGGRLEVENRQGAVFHALLTRL